MMMMVLYSDRSLFQVHYTRELSPPGPFLHHHHQVQALVNEDFALLLIYVKYGVTDVTPGGKR